MKYKVSYGGALIDNREKKAILKIVNENWWQISQEGEKMEKEAAKSLGVKYCVLANSGSSAGLLALSALELPKGSEVIISACTFPTIFNIIIQCGLTPVVVDAKVGTYTFDIKEVEQAISSKTKAIIAIHPVGNPVNMSELMKLAKRKKLIVLEDNCDGWGGTIGGKKLGAWGDVSFTSFHAAHIVSMGEGGGVFTNDKDLAKKVRMYRDWGRQADVTKPHRVKTLPKDYNPRFVYEKIGYNLKPLELQAAMGRIQLKKAEKIKKFRKANFDYFYKNLTQFPDLILPKKEKSADPCWFAFPLTCRGSRGELVAWLESHGIETRSMFAGNIIRHPAYKKIKYRIGRAGLKEADQILRQSFWIGVHPRMTRSDRGYVLKVFKKFYKINPQLK